MWKELFSAHSFNATFLTGKYKPTDQTKHSAVIKWKYMYEFSWGSFYEVSNILHSMKNNRSYETS